jgi:hypothetical protein
MARLGSSHFKSLYSADRRVSIDVVITDGTTVPNFVEEEEMKNLWQKYQKQN